LLKNFDSAAHTVTSGTPADGPDGIFDSSLFMSGERNDAVRFFNLTLNMDILQEKFLK